MPPPVVHDGGGELRDLLLDAEVVQADRARAGQEHDGRPLAAARPVHEEATAVDLLEASDQRSELS
ncbi:hypothetical protein ABZ442_25225 [Streptomyces triculaminicus]|uniref:hypothetical protein n=1 Tax=Streptomyces triculaminicus TaxID=2816232 RepID=UPI0033EB2675